MFPLLYSIVIECWLLASAPTLLVSVMLQLLVSIPYQLDAQLFDHQRRVPRLGSLISDRGSRVHASMHLSI